MIHTDLQNESLQLIQTCENSKKCWGNTSHSHGLIAEASTNKEKYVGMVLLFPHKLLPFRSIFFFCSHRDGSWDLWWTFFFFGVACILSPPSLRNSSWYIIKTSTPSCLSPPCLLLWGLEWKSGCESQNCSGWRGSLRIIWSNLTVQAVSS